MLHSDRAPVMHLPHSSNCVRRIRSNGFLIVDLIKEPMRLNPSLVGCDFLRAVKDTQRASIKSQETDKNMFYLSVDNK